MNLILQTLANIGWGEELDLDFKSDCNPKLTSLA